MTVFIRRLHHFFWDVAKVMCYFLGLYFFLRCTFLISFWTQWWGSDAVEIVKTFFYGMRINLKSASLLTAIWMIGVGFPFLIWGQHKICARIQKILMGILLGLVLSLGLAQIPYYEYFNTGYNYMLFQGMNENLVDLIQTLLGNVRVWILVGLLIGGWFVFLKLFLFWMDQKIPSYPRWIKGWGDVIYGLVLLSVIGVLAVYCRFGGSLTYEHSLHWENFAVVSNDCLNEAILDSAQGMYRAFEQRKLMEETFQMEISREELQGLLLELATHPEADGNELSAYIKREASGASIGTPSHIFIIIGESQGQWPLLPEYEALPLAEGMREIIRRSDTVWIPDVLGNGPYTPMGIQAITIGLADAKQTPQFQKETYRSPYETAIAPQMGQLGYRSYFWYGGSSAWERLEELLRAQGFNQFYGSAELGVGEKNVWGIPDRDLYEGILSRLDAEPSLHVIMTTSNHAPYSIDYIAAGFPLEEVKNQLSSAQQKDQRLLDRLGHYWYADHEMARFVKEAREKYPDSLFVITSDHQGRVNLENAPGLKKKVYIPIVISGKGVQASLFESSQTHSQLQIIPTLIELVAPKGFVYYSLLPSLTEENKQAANMEYWAHGGILGSRLSSEMEPANSSEASLRNEKWESALLSYSWWRVIKGPVF